ncbi:MAG: hypothetical protein OIF50_09935 [Flavobacteriaceae bacterium]|nr:hypothetical protein [Flavobacteriaceae bacterium]
MEQKYCLECERKLIGRIDKKFCSDSCRNTYNNRLNKDKTNLMRNTNSLLRKNYRILESLNTKGKTTVTKKTLERKSFSFELITSIYTTRKGTVYYFIYDQGYLPLENEMYMLVKKN